MEDLSYIIGLGFSGSDIWRAVTIAFFAAMMVRKSRQVALTAAWALLVDRVIWPLLDMSFSGASSEAVFASLGAMGQTLNADLGLYLVRYAGLFALITMFFWMRRRIHTPRKELQKKNNKGHKPAYS